MTATQNPASINQALERHARLRPESTMIQDGDQTVTYAEFIRKRDQLGESLRGFGVPEGSRAAILIPQSEFLITCFFAFQRVSVTPMILPFQSKTAELIENCDSFQIHTLVLTQDRFDGIRKELEAALPATLRFLLIHDEERNETRHLDLQKEAQKGVRSEPDEAVIQLTSGSAEKPRGAVFAHQAELDRTARIAEAYQFTHQDRFLLMNGLIWRSIAFGILQAGGCLVILPFPALPDLAMSEIDRQKVSVMAAPPLFYNQLLSRGAGSNYSLSSLRLCISNGILTPDEIKSAWAKQYPGNPLVSHYALTETGPVAAAVLPKSRMKTACVGQALPGVELRISTEGELLVRNAGFFRGYFGQSEATRTVLDEQDWFHTGDRVNFDAEGDLIYLGRIKDTIKHQGWSVSPAAVERVIRELPEIQDTKVFGIDLGTGDETIVAGILLHSPLEPDVLIAHCRRRLATYMVPERVVALEASDYSSSGKILKEKVLKRMGIVR